MADVELKGRVSDADYGLIVAAGRSSHARDGLPWFATIIGLMSFSLLVERVEPAPLRWLPGACGVALFWLAYLRPQRQVKPLAMRIRRVALDGTGVECESEGGFLRFDWARVSRVVRRRDVVMLVLENGSYVPLLRSWASDEAHWKRVNDAVPTREFSA